MTGTEEDFVPDYPADADGIPAIAADDLPDSEILHTAPAIAEYEAPEYEEADDAIPTAEEGAGVLPQDHIQRRETPAPLTVTAAREQPHFLWYAAAFLLTAAAGAAVFGIRRALRRSDGSTQTGDAPANDLSALMAQTAEDPPAHLREKIMSQIKNE